MITTQEHPALRQWPMTSCPCCGEIQYGASPWTCDDCRIKDREARKRQAPVMLAMLAMLASLPPVATLEPTADLADCLMVD